MGQTVRVHATWRYGFEWSYLFDTKCPDAPKTYVKFAADEKLCSASKSNLNKMTHGTDNKANVVVVGEFSGGGGYGHRAMYNYEVIVTCLERYESLPADGF